MCASWLLSMGHANGPSSPPSFQAESASNAARGMTSSPLALLISSFRFGFYVIIFRESAKVGLHQFEFFSLTSHRLLLLSCGGYISNLVDGTIT